VAPPWEDPQYEEYHVTDKYGFIQWVLIHGKLGRYLWKPWNLLNILFIWWNLRFWNICIVFLISWVVVLIHSINCILHLLATDRLIISHFCSSSDTRLPETHTKEEERNIEVETNRKLKWHKMTKDWHKYHGAGVKHRPGLLDVVWWIIRNRFA